MSNPSVARPIQVAVKSARSAAFKRWLPNLLMPMIGLLAFVLFWQLVAGSIDTSLGKFPGPAQVASQFGQLVEEQKRDQIRADAFLEN